MAKEDRNGSRKSRSQARKHRIPELGYYFIITDTDETEKNYFEGLRNALPKEIKDKIVIKVYKTKTSNLVDYCKEKSSLYPQYSEPWIVFDRDRVVNFDHIIENAESNDINAAWSNPCFEIWLFAYFGLMPNIGASEKCCKEFATKFKKEAGINYDKANTDIYKKLIELISLLLRSSLTNR